MLVINNMGVFLDGVKVEETGPDWGFLDSFGEMKLCFECHPEDGCAGGLALYGNNPNRHAMLMRLGWNEDGTPRFSYT